VPDARRNVLETYSPPPSGTHRRYREVVSFRLSMMKIAADDLSDYLIGFRVPASVRRRGPDLDGN
jgi:hypothetical protein